MATLQEAVLSKQYVAVTDALESGENVNWQNSAGDTALHLAISVDASLDILRSLVEHGASLAVKNSEGESPTDKLNIGSSDTLHNLLKIPQVQTFRYKHGDTILHELVTYAMDHVYEIRKADEAVDKFWECVAHDDDIDLEVLNPNTQGEDGHTILHTAASFPLPERQLKPLLTHFSNIDPFLRDCKGETFLHAFFSDDMCEEEDFGRNLLTGQFCNCNGSVIKELLGIKNIHGQTPLHVYIKSELQTKGVNFRLYPFAEAGADLNATDSIRETALHYMLQFREEDTDERDTDDKFPEEDFSDIIEPWKENLKYLVQNGANINAVNAYGETPLFLAEVTDMADALMDLGADHSVINSLKQSPLLSYLCKDGRSEKFVKLLLDKGANVNLVDAFGNTALHYAAWNGASEDIMVNLRKHDAKAIKDQQGHYPCQVAQFRGHIYLVDLLCSWIVCAKDHQHKQTVCGTGNVIKSEHFDNKQEDVKLQLHQILGTCSVLELATCPGIGAVDFIGEANDIKAAVYNFVTQLCNDVAEESQYLRNTLFQSGSVGENTKTGVPDEFDFVFILDEICKTYEVDEDKSREDQSFVYLRKRSIAMIDDDFVTEDGYMDVFYVRELLDGIVSKCFEKQAIFKGRLKSIYKSRASGASAPTINFRLRWVGAVYKNLEIDIDFVPACCVRGWWPDGTMLDNLDCDVEAARNEGALLLIQDTTVPMSISDSLERKPACRVSALRVEKAHMAAIPALPKKAYIACKVLCNKHICPSLYTMCTVTTRDIITSYMLKLCMFHVYQSYKYQNRTSELEPLNVQSEERILHEFVVQIFETFLQFATKKKLYSFVLPWQNVFTFTTERVKELKRLHKVYRMTFAKMVLNILGEDHNFDDVDRKVWFHTSTEEFSDGYTDDGMDKRYVTGKNRKKFECIDFTAGKYSPDST